MKTSFVSTGEIKRVVLVSFIGIITILLFNYFLDLYSFKTITENSVNRVADRIPMILSADMDDPDIEQKLNKDFDQLFRNTVLPEEIITVNITDYSCNILWNGTFNSYDPILLPCRNLKNNVTQSSWISPLGSYQNLIGGQSIFLVRSPFYSEEQDLRGILEIYFDTAGFSSVWFFLRVIKVSFASIISTLAIISFYLIFKRRSEELAKELTTYATIIREAPLGIYTINKEGLIETFNPKMTFLSGAKDPSEVIGLNALSISSYQASGLDKHFKEGLEGKSFNVETPYVSYTANKKTYRRYLGSPIFSDDGKKVEKLLLIVEDITERKELEEAKKDFIAIASHEMRTPLTIIRGASERITKKLPKDVDAEVFLMIKHINDNSIRMLGIVNSFLDVGRLENKALAFNIEVFDINELITEIIEEMTVRAENKGLYLKTNFIKRNISIRADRSKTREVIVNLISNALQYTKVGGITLQTSFYESFVKINIIDTGIGIPKDMFDNIFQKFRSVHKEFITSKEYGSGMGLYISKTLTENMNGKLYLESSTLNKGSVFTLLLPFSK